MKKTGIFFIILTVLFTMICSGCYITTTPGTVSVYNEDWFAIKGYITNTEDPFENSKVVFDKFVADNDPSKSGISRSDFAICYKHAYDRKPRGSITFKQWNPDTLEYEDMEDGNYQIEITSQADSNSVPGFIYYCDEEDVCIINNLYKYDLTLHSDTKKHADFCFIISINGIKSYTFYMDKYIDKSNPFSN